MRINGREVSAPPRKTRNQEPRVAISSHNEPDPLILSPEPSMWPLAPDTIGALKAELDRLVAPPESLELGETGMARIVLRGKDLFLRYSDDPKDVHGANIPIPREQMRELKELCEAALSDA